LHDDGGGDGDCDRETGFTSRGTTPRRHHSALDGPKHVAARIEESPESADELRDVVVCVFGSSVGPLGLVRRSPALVCGVVAAHQRPPAITGRFRDHPPGSGRRRSDWWSGTVPAPYRSLPSTCVTAAT